MTKIANQTPKPLGGFVRSSEGTPGALSEADFQRYVELIKTNDPQSILLASVISAHAMVDAQAVAELLADIERLPSPEELEAIEKEIDSTEHRLANFDMEIEQLQRDRALLREQWTKLKNNPKLTVGRTGPLSHPGLAIRLQNRVVTAACRPELHKAGLIPSND